MNGSTMSNSRTSLSDSFINLSHTLRLQNYTENEYSELIKEKLKNTLEEADIKYIISKYILYSKDNKNNSFREIMKMQKYFSEIKHVGYDELLDLILYPEKEKIFPVEDCELKLYKNTLFFGKQDFYITYPKKSKNEIKTLFTNSQKDALMKILVGIKAENTILLTGEINSGKTFLIEQLANLIEIKLRTIQFMKETNSSDLIGKFELKKKNISSLKINLNKIQNYLIKNEFNNITKFIIFNKKMDIRELINI
jgi:midasin (ATPase involved in ribosome maturation)